MIVLGRIGDTEADRDLVNERRVRKRYTRGAEVRAGMEDKLVDSNGKRRPLEERSGGAAVLVGDDAGELSPLRRQRIELDGHPRRGPSARRIEHMGREAAHRLFVIPPIRLSASVNSIARVVHQRARL